jgi:acyl-[acyl carrier protein]--UDP-N-acetylglucosamine O-acyltransferase
MLNVELSIQRSTFNIQHSTFNIIMSIHQLAVVHPNAQIGEDVSIGPFAVIGEHVIIGKGCKIGPHVVIDGCTQIGEFCEFPLARVLVPHRKTSSTKAKRPV